MERWLRHLRFLLLFSPNWLFFYPSLLLVTLSILFGSIIIFKPLEIGTVVFDVHTLICLAFALVSGVQLIFFHFFVKIFSVISGLVPEYKGFKKTFNYFNLETGLAIGVVTLLIGIGVIISNFYTWSMLNFSDLEPVIFIRKILVGIVAFTLGIQIITNSFIFSVIGLKRK